MGVNVFLKGTWYQHNKIRTMYDVISDYKQVLQQHVQDQYATGLLANSLLVSTDQSRHKISGFATIIIFFTLTMD